MPCGSAGSTVFGFGSGSSTRFAVAVRRSSVTPARSSTVERTLDGVVSGSLWSTTTAANTSPRSAIVLASIARRSSTTAGSTAWSSASSAARVDAARVIVRSIGPIYGGEHISLPGPPATGHRPRGRAPPAVTRWGVLEGVDRLAAERQADCRGVQATPTDRPVAHQPTRPEYTVSHEGGAVFRSRRRVVAVLEDVVLGTEGAKRICPRVDDRWMCVRVRVVAHPSALWRLRRGFDSRTRTFYRRPKEGVEPPDGETRTTRDERQRVSPPSSTLAPGPELQSYQHCPVRQSLHVADEPSLSDGDVFLLLAGVVVQHIHDRLFVFRDTNLWILVGHTSSERRLTFLFSACSVITPWPRSVLTTDDTRQPVIWGRLRITGSGPRSVSWRPRLGVSSRTESDCAALSRRLAFPVRRRPARRCGRRPRVALSTDWTG